jgi:hypothetical protein
MKQSLLFHRTRAFGALVCAALAGLFLAVAPHVRAADGPFAVSFDGVDDYVFAPHNASYNASQLAVTAWIKTTQTTGEVGLVNKYVAGSLNGWNVFLFNGEVRAWYFRDNANFVWDGARSQRRLRRGRPVAPHCFRRGNRCRHSLCRWSRARLAWLDGHAGERDDHPGVASGKLSGQRLLSRSD